MKTAEIIFSPTGGTQKVADIITDQCGEREIIDLSNCETDFSIYIIEKDDTVLIAMPVFASRPPAVAIDRLKEIKGNGAKCSVVCVYGNGDYGNTLWEMKEAAEESGFMVTSAVAAVAQHSIIPKYAHGRPDEADRRQLADFAAQIRDKTGNISANLYHEIESNEKEAEPEAPSNPPLPEPGQSCTGCGLCLRSCPVDAISPEDFTADVMKCIFCMRCCVKCPDESRKVNEEVISLAASALEEMCSGRKENELFV